jgi:putative aldouronate transport system permease protein
MGRKRGMMMKTLTRKPGKDWRLFLLAFPFIVLLILFRYVPLFGWSLSVFEYRPGIPVFENKFVGFKHFLAFFGGRDFYRVMKNTLIFSFFNYILIPLPMIFAVLINEINSRHLKKAFQTLTTIPHFFSWIVVYSLSFAIFSNDGLLNEVLRKAGMKEQSLLINPDAVYFFQTGIYQWKVLGWNAIIYIAALTGIDQDLYEAARVDGAGRIRCAWHITVPGLMPTLIVLALLAVGNFVNNGLQQYFAFRNNFVDNNIEVLDLYTYRVGLKMYDFSFSTAVGIFKSAISIFLLFITNYLAKKFRGTSII